MWSYAFLDRGKDTMNGLTDIHCHILPGVDDGAADLSGGLEMVRLAYEDGIRTLLLTPHYRGRFKHDPAYLQEQFARFQQAVPYPDMTLYLGCEAHWEADLPDALSEGRVLSLHGSDYLLLEFDPTTLASQVVQGVSEILRCGYTPIVAHAERYDAFLKNRQLLDEVTYMGGLIQLNADSVMGKYGFVIRQFCRRALKNRRVHFIASDAHDAKARTPSLKKCYSWVCKKYTEAYAARLFHGNAQVVLENELL